MKVLTKKFFESANTVLLARRLLGKFLVCRRRGKTSVYIITEVEAYDGPRDKASHAHRGKTARNAPMFGEAGHWYVYFVYGTHWMLNIVTGPKDYPAAILIRGASKFPEIGSLGIPRYPISGKLISGPGRLTRALHINKKLNNMPATMRGGLWIEDRGARIPKKLIKRAPRIGISYAQEWAKKPYRFYI